MVFVDVVNGTSNLEALIAAAVGWAGWRLLDDTRPHGTENQIAISMLAFIFALWLPTPF